MSEWKPLPDETAAYETAVECAAKLRLAHSLLVDVVSSLRHLDDHGGELFDNLMPLPREVDKAQQQMVEIYRRLRK